MPAPAPLSAPLNASPRVLAWIAAMAEALALPLLLLRQDGLLVNANMSGLRELARGTRLVRVDGQVRAAAQDQREVFSQLLAAVAATGERQVWGEQDSDGPVLLAPVDRRRHARTADSDAPLLMVVMPAEASAADACTLFAYQYGLSPGEFEVLHALCTGHSPSEIARARNVSTSTVRTQMARLRRKCGVQDMQILSGPTPR
jgi:DNA-binding CsgD family transcriptional regulator